MQHPFAQQRPEIEHLLSICRVTRPRIIEEGVDRIVRAGLDQYRELADAVGVPAVLLSALDLREDDCNPRSGIGQGDPWNRVSVHVPRGKGPFGSRLQANIFYVRYDHLDSLAGLDPPTWTWAFSVYKANAWNGWGPNMHGRHSGYVWSGTSVYDEQTDGVVPGGKYVADGRWDPGARDEQPGTLPVMLELARVHPDLAFAPIPVTRDSAAAPPAPSMPAGFGDTVKGVEHLQEALNRLGEAGVFTLEEPLAVDGNFGRRTRTTLRLFQAARGLSPDGVLGPETEAALAGDRVAGDDERFKNIQRSE